MSGADSIKSIVKAYTEEVKQKQTLKEGVKLPINKSSRMPRGVKREDIRDFVDSLKNDRQAVAIVNEINKMAPKFIRSLEAGSEWAPDETPEYSYEDVLAFREKIGKKNETLDAILKGGFNFLGAYDEPRQEEPEVIRGNIRLGYDGALYKKEIERAGGFVKVLGWIVFLLESSPKYRPSQ